MSSVIFYFNYFKDLTRQFSKKPQDFFTKMFYSANMIQLNSVINKETLFFDIFLYLGTLCMYPYIKSKKISRCDNVRMSYRMADRYLTYH